MRLPGMNSRVENFRAWVFALVAIAVCCIRFVSPSVSYHVDDFRGLQGPPLAKRLIQMGETASIANAAGAGEPAEGAGEAYSDELLAFVGEVAAVPGTERHVAIWTLRHIGRGEASAATLRAILEDGKAESADRGNAAFGLARIALAEDLKRLAAMRDDLSIDLYLRVFLTAALQQRLVHSH